MENKRKHLEFIQITIVRMAGSSFLLKAWSVTLVVALYALSAKDASPKLFAISLFPVLIFWLLDGYYLSQERLFRALYNEVRNKEEEKIDFSMSTKKFSTNCDNTWLFAIFSKTPLIFYASIIILMLAVYKFAF